MISMTSLAKRHISYNHKSTALFFPKINVINKEMCWFAIKVYIISIINNNPIKPYLQCKIVITINTYKKENYVRIPLFEIDFKAIFMDYQINKQVWYNFEPKLDIRV